MESLAIMASIIIFTSLLVCALGGWLIGTFIRKNLTVSCILLLALIAIPWYVFPRNICPPLNIITLLSFSTARWIL